MRDKEAGSGAAAAGTSGSAQQALDVALLSKAVAHVEHLLESPDWVLDATTEDAQKAAAQARKFVKLFFDAAQVRCPRRVQQLSNLGPRGLVVKGFSNEQIWEELEVQNIPLRRHLRSRIARVAQGKVSLKGVGSEEKARRKGAAGDDGDAEEVEKVEVEKTTKAKRKGSKVEAEAKAEVSASKAKGKKKDKAKKKPGPDEPEAEAAWEGDPNDPFSIAAMNAFADAAEDNMRLFEDAEDSDFGPLEAGSDEEDEAGKTAMFGDFYKKGNGEDQEEDEPEVGIGGKKAEKKHTKDKVAAKTPAPPSDEEAMEVEGSGDDESEDDEDEEEGEEEAQIDGEAAADDLSDEEKELEERLNKMQAGEVGSDEDDGEEEEEEEGQEESAKVGGERSLYDMDKSLRSLEDEVAKLEEEQLEEKPWMLKGEVSARQRPLNSLLEIHMEKPMSFFAGRRAEAAVETAGSEDEAALEDVRGAADLAPRKKLDVDAIIRQRIWDEAFDDVVRKFQLPPAQRKRKEEEDALETLNFEKSRVGLGEIYAKQYETELLGHKTDEQEKEDKDKAEAKALFGKIMFKLDQLTNAHFTPRPPMLGISQELNKVPALKMEETIPLMVSDAHLKAPEEIKKARRHEREQEELTHDERAAKRRLKKASRKKALHQKVEDGKMTLSGLRERAEVLGKKNKDAKLEKERQAKPRDARKKIKGSELMAEAQAANAAGSSRREEQRKERMQRPEGALPSKKLKL